MPEDPYRARPSYSKAGVGSPLAVHVAACVLALLVVAPSSLPEGTPAGTDGRLVRAATDRAIGPGDGSRQSSETVPEEPQPPLVRYAIGVALPLGGPPAVAGFAELVRQGVEVAAAVRSSEGVQVDVLVRDYGAQPRLAAAVTRELQRSGALGVVGFLEEEALLAAGRGRGSRLTLISPTARNAEAAGAGVYSLEGPDPRSAKGIAHAASEMGYLRVGIVHSRTRPSLQEAIAFEEEARLLELPVVARLAYDAGATYFEEQLTGVAEALRMEEIAALGLGEEDTLDASLLDSVALYLPVPVEDVELLAPQVTHFGLDTLAIHVLGNASWTDNAVLTDIDARHTTGVLAPTTIWPEMSVAASVFRERYEERFASSLTSPVPALGYDAAMILMQAIDHARGRSDQVASGFRELGAVTGATGIFFVDAGRVLRRTRIVRIRDGELVEPGAAERSDSTGARPASADAAGKGGAASGSAVPSGL